MTLPRPTLLITLLAAVAFAAPAAAPEASAQPTMTHGIPWTGSVGTHRTVAELKRLGVSSLGPPAQHMAEREHEWPDRSHLKSSPGAADAAQYPAAELDATTRTRESVASIAGPQTASTTFTGATLSGAHPTFSFPPDGMGTVGPTQFVVFVNGRIVTYDKLSGAADGVLDVDADVFFGGINNGSGTSDPRIRYDRLTGRWFLVIINLSTPDWVLLAVSDAAGNGVISPSTVFTFFSFPINTPPPAISASCFADYPTLGVDANALYIGTNNFCPSSYNSSDGFVVRKSSVMGGGPLVVTALRGLVPTSGSDGPYTPQGVDNYDPAATEGYFIGVSNLFYSKLMLRRVSNPGGTPSVSSNITITPPLATTAPTNVNHLGNTGGTNGRLSALDDRLFAAHLRNGRLWTAHNINVGPTGAANISGQRDGSRWYELQNIVSPGVPSVRQSGTVFTAGGLQTDTNKPSFWVPTVMVSGQGHAAMGMSTADSLIRADAVFTGRLAGDALATMAAPTPYTFSTGSYNPSSDPGQAGLGRRWGDYSFTSLDPIDDMTMWTIQEFVDATDSYGVQVVRLNAPPPATPTSATSVAALLPSVVSTVTGTSVSGSGFFDPGPNLAAPALAFSHLSAQVTALGVTGTPPTVNSATYLDPTHVQLNLNTMGATISQPGEKYSVRITNPDGQVIAANVLQVTGTVGVGDPAAAGFELGPVAPNPTGGAAGVDFSLPRAARVRVTVVDLAGRVVSTLADGLEPAGRHHVSWSGGAAPAGMYFMRYQAPGRTMVRRFVRLR